MTCEETLDTGVVLATGQDRPMRRIVVGYVGDDLITRVPRLMIPPFVGCALGVAIVIIAARRGATGRGARAPEAGSERRR